MFKNLNQPIIGASLGLLAGGLGGRMNPLQAAMMGAQLGQSMQDRQDRQKRERAYRDALARLGGAPGPQVTAGPGGIAPGAAQQLNLPPGMGELLAAMGPEQGMPLLGRILMQKPQQRRVMQDAEGFQRYVDTGERVFPEAQAKPTQRKIIKGADGFNYYADTGERVLPDVQAQQGGPFEGTSMDAQASNILLTGDPSSAAYRAAYARMSQPRQTFNAQTGEVYTVTPDMSWATPPTGTTATGAQGADMPSGVSVTQVREPKFTQEEKTAAGFANRLESANEIIGQFEDVGTEYWGYVAGQDMPQFMKSPERQQLQQAERDFVNAVLRRESGAVINEKEFENARQQYFPQPGDDPETVEQKRVARLIAFENMQRAAGRAYRPSNVEQSAPTGQRRRYNPETGTLE